MIIGKTDYVDKIENLLNDVLRNNTETSWQVSVKLVASYSISGETRRSLKPVEHRPGIIYGLCKVYKDTVDYHASFDLFCLQLILLPIN